MISSGLPDPVFKNKKNTFSFNCSLSQKLHWKYKSHWAIRALARLLYSNMMFYDVWWKVSRPNIGKVSGMPKIQLLIKKYGRKQLLLLYTANTTIEACPELVSAFYRLWPHKPYSRVMRTPPPHTNTIVRSVWPESWRTRSIAKSRRAWMTAIAPITSHTKTWSYWRVQSAPTSASVVLRECPHLTRVWQTRDSIPGLNDVLRKKLNCNRSWSCS